MKDSCERITLDVRQTKTQRVVRAKQGDTARALWIDLADGGKPYTIEPDCFATFTARKPDGTKICNACTISDNRIVYPFTLQTCSAPGYMEAEIKLYGADEKLLTSASFLLEICETLVSEGDEIASEAEMDALNALILETTALKTEVEEKLKNGDFTGPQGEKGEKGETGTTPHIGSNGNWYLGERDTGLPSRGETGAKGDRGDTGAQGQTGNGIASAQLNEDYTLTLKYTDGTQYTTPSIQGVKGDQGEKGATGEQGLPGMDGVDGQHGSRILKVKDTRLFLPETTACANGFTSSWKIVLSSVKTDANVDEVRVGDVIWSSYYHYPVGYVGDDYAYLGARVYFRGPAGQDGGVNVTGATPGQMILVKAVDQEGKPTQWEAVDVQKSDWLAMEGEPGHILNRPFGDEVVYILPEQNITFVMNEDAGMNIAFIELAASPVAGTQYTVKFGEEEYTSICYDMSGDGTTLAIGNLGPFGLENTGEPFIILIDHTGEAIVNLLGEGTVACSAYGIQPVAVAPEYAPEAVLIDLIEAGLPVVNTTERVHTTIPNARDLHLALSKGAVRLRFHLALPLAEDWLTGYITSFEESEIVVSPMISRYQQNEFQFLSVFWGYMIGFSFGIGAEGYLVTAFAKPLWDAA